MSVNIAYGRIAAVRPANTNEQDLYALGAGEEFIGRIIICNQDSTARTYNIAVTDTGTGVAASGEDWIEYGTEIPANTAFEKRVEVAATGTIRIQASIADLLSFALMGMIKTTT